MSISSNGHLQEEANGGEDSDLEFDFANAAAESNDDYYQPISAHNGSISDTESDSEEPDPNLGYHHMSEVNGNGIASLNLNTEDSESESEPESEQEDSAAGVEASISSIRDERRIAPLTQETTVRIMDVMRGIEFRGAAPAWADQVPEDQWLDQLRRIRGDTNAMPSSN